MAEEGGRWVVPWAEVGEVARGTVTIVSLSSELATRVPPRWLVLSLDELISSGPQSGDLVVTGLWLRPDPEQIFRVISDAAPSGRIILVVPNVARPSLIRRLALGLGDAELPPPSPGGLFTRERLDRLAAEVGLVRVPHATRAPKGPSLSGRPFDDLLATVAADAGVHDRDMLVRAYEHLDEGRGLDSPVPPFLTVLLRTQGRRPHALADVLLCLSAQTCPDFEILVLAHDVEPPERAALEALLETQPNAFRARLHLITVVGGGRSEPLRQGAQRARGRYLAVLDDDDLVMSDWVSVFRNLATEQPGRIVRALAAEQEVAALPAGARPPFRSASWPRRPWERGFSLVSHIVDNHSPVHSYAYPIEVFTEHGLTFDATLAVLEDWDLLVRAASLVGVTDADQITCLYRRWPATESSYSQHPEAGWPATAWCIVRAWDERPLLLPSGSATRLRRDGIWVLQHRPLRATLLIRLERWSHRWSMIILRTPLGLPVRRIYRHLRTRMTPS